MGQNKNNPACQVFEKYGTPSSFVHSGLLQGPPHLYGVSSVTTVAPLANLSYQHSMSIQTQMMAYQPGSWEF